MVLLNYGYGGDASLFIAGLILVTAIMAGVFWIRKDRRSTNSGANKKTGVAIQITSQALNRIKELMAESSFLYLRLAVGTGCCASEKYLLNLESCKAEDDAELEINGLKLLVSPKDQPLLDGTTIDYVPLGLTAGGFKIVNPNIIPRCGCGSFHANHAK